VDDLINRELDRLRREHPHGVALVDVPLMFEVGWQQRFQPVVVVYVPRSVQLARLMARDGATLEQAEKALNAQMPLEQKRSLAKFVVDNSGSLEETRKKVADIWEQLRTLPAKDHAG
jgi:dephospho-CoA kinase